MLSSEKRANSDSAQSASSHAYFWTIAKKLFPRDLNFLQICHPRIRIQRPTGDKATSHIRLRLPLAGISSSAENFLLPTALRRARCREQSSSRSADRKILCAMRCIGVNGPHAVRNNEQRRHVKSASPHLTGNLTLRPTSRPRVQGQIWGNTGEMRGDCWIWLEVGILEGGCIQGET